jgi:CheY-like chemotaxis protein
VDCAVDGAEAVEKYRAAQRSGVGYDLVIMDLTVPGGMGGLAALGKLREINPAVKAVVSSGYSSDPVLANYREHGFAAVVAKPYEVDEIAGVLREMLPAG